MGTRGFFGILKGDIYKRCYTSLDAYPSYLGDKVVEFIRDTTIEELSDIYDNIELVNMNDYPTNKQIKECALNGFYMDGMTWRYIITAPPDFDLSVYRNFKYMIDFDEEKASESYDYWDYKYVINLNSNTLDIYPITYRNVYISFPLDDVYSRDMIDLENKIEGKVENDD